MFGSNDRLGAFGQTFHLGEQARQFFPRDPTVLHLLEQAQVPQQGCSSDGSGGGEDDGWGPSLRSPRGLRGSSGCAAGRF